MKNTSIIRNSCSVCMMFALLLLASAAIAMPLESAPIKIRQPGGEIAALFVTGDEYSNRLHDRDGFTVMKHPFTGIYVYADSIGGRLVPTDYTAGSADPYALGLVPGLRNTTSAGSGSIGEGSPPTRGRAVLAPRTGQLANLVVFVRFQDENEFDGAISDYNDLFNDSSTDAISLYNYYKEVTYDSLEVISTFHPAPQGGNAASFQDSHPRGYYLPYNEIDNPIGYQGDEAQDRGQSLFLAAAGAVATGIAPGQELDYNGDGYIDNITFIISSGEAEWGQLLWPKQGALYSENLFINEKRAWTYNIQINSLLTGEEGDRFIPDSFGVRALAHELFHSMGAPDLYRYTDYDFTSIGKWDIMHLSAGHMSSYLKHRYGGWIESVPEITSSGAYTLNPLTSQAGNAYRLASPNSSEEYFLLEYRKKEGVFEGELPGSGLVVYRVNTARDGFGNKWGPPDELYVFRPGGAPGENGLADEAYLSSGAGRTEFGNSTDPFGFLSDGTLGGVQISNIGAAGETISFTVTICVSDCSGKVCGDNGCGGSCGSCDPGQVCTEAGQCTACTPDCGDRVCGDDGCGGSCGPCGELEVCTEEGQCEFDGMSGQCEACPEVSCPSGYVCIDDGRAESFCAKTCDDDGACPNEATCKEQDRSRVCIPDYVFGYCLDNDVHVTDACGRSITINECNDLNETCDDLTLLCAPLGGGERSCTNELDDDGDSFTDCYDADCMWGTDCWNGVQCEICIDGHPCAENYTCINYSTRPDRPFCVKDCSGDQTCPEGSTCHATNQWCSPDQKVGYSCIDNDLHGVDSCGIELLIQECDDDTELCSEDLGACADKNSEVYCSNEIDDDKDGQTDCDDTDCAFLADCGWTGDLCDLCDTAHQCEDGYGCTDTGLDFFLCLQNCDPIEKICPEGFMCYTESDFNRCVPDMDLAPSYCSDNDLYQTDPCGYSQMRIECVDGRELCDPEYGEYGGCGPMPDGDEDDVDSPAIYHGPAPKDSGGLCRGADEADILWFLACLPLLALRRRRLNGLLPRY